MAAAAEQSERKTGDAKALNFIAEIHEINKKDFPELYEIFKLDRLPLPGAEFSFEVKNVPTAFANGIRRVLTDELSSYRLGIDELTFIDYDKHTEVYCTYSMLLQSISNIRIKYNISPTEASKMRLKLSITNTSQFNIPVYSGDLQVTNGDAKLLMCNPNIQLAIVTPGKSIFVDNIKLIKDTGKNSGFNTVGCQVSAIPLDLPEYKKEEYTSATGKAANLACYIPQSTVVNPRHHKISGIFNCIESIGDIKTIICDSFDNIVKRLQKIEVAISDESTKTVDVVYDEKSISDESNTYEASLVVTGETHTIAVLITKYVFDNNPKIEEVNYMIENDTVYFTIKSSKNIKSQLLISIKKIINDFKLVKESFLLLK